MSWTDQHQTQETHQTHEPDENTRDIDETVDTWLHEDHQEQDSHPEDIRGADANERRGRNATSKPDASPAGDSDSPSESRSGSVGASDDPLSMAQCPHCDGRRFVSKKLVYEEFHYTETEQLEHHQTKVRAEFEFSCLGCQKRFHELPQGARSYYTEVAVLRQDLRRAIRMQTRAWFESLADVFRRTTSD